eukprot:1139334-Pelagomonas_calceolata.AAC.21
MTPVPRPRPRLYQGQAQDKCRRISRKGPLFQLASEASEHRPVPGLSQEALPLTMTFQHSPAEMRLEGWGEQAQTQVCPPARSRCLRLRS